MIALLQRVTRASVTIDDQEQAAIGAGLLVFVAAVPDDTPARAERLAERVLGYRVFADASGRMNRSAIDAGLAVLAVPQFTLAADTRRGTRPGFSSACPPDRAAPLFDVFVTALRTTHRPVAQGLFGADMQVGLINDGPVTFWLQS
ncbi:D-aminoacyl-tRNA deacylase [Salinisphaera sp. T31B1]|uniref:D-aminoacyl-tRNA deacylase n=1 Tax=Salinisphaera sp. T31B1 TaxID=727963 RepID=UPI003340B6DC